MFLKNGLDLDNPGSWPLAYRRHVIGASEPWHETPEPVTCIYCGARPAEPGSDYCSAICEIDALTDSAERDRR